MGHIIIEGSWIDVLQLCKFKLWLSRPASAPIIIKFLVHSYSLNNTYRLNLLSFLEIGFILWVVRLLQLHLTHEDQDDQEGWSTLHLYMIRADKDYLLVETGDKHEIIISIF